MIDHNRSVIQTDRAPAPIGPYSQAIKAGGLVFVSGQLGLDLQTGNLVSPDPAEQARKAIEHILNILDLAGSGPGRVVKTTIFLTNLADFAAVNKVYGEVFGFEPPARSTVQVAALPKGGAVEIEVIAQVGMNMAAGASAGGGMSQF